ncbi:MULTISPECIES: dTDP-4-dehydrorhamnose reductase [Vagococcus]|uniref:dTDP-4-dehydrorhamnose reductase n=1 Tax=Vagococcus TaxID=2737 RepID=UPI000E4AEB93|nr:MULTISPECIES: dTDP-4-dehydrorhamnose reductase [Vagococcus]RHH71574.1 dTDP-4-dehydrorhamnose reductase [Vagococcus sp. AM17-17]
MTVLVTGAKGQLGRELTNLLKQQNIDFIAYDSQEMDITDFDKTLSIIKDIKPSVVYHCAAYTAVDLAEDEGKEMNYLVNVDGTKNVAQVCKEVGATLVYISTDYVFDGKTRETPYMETDKTSPINEYGKAKLLGEQAVQEILNNYYIIRTSWVFGEHGNNFVYTMKKLAKTHDKLTVVNDQVGRPTWTKSLAEFMTYLIQNKCDYGIYHFSNEETCTWYEFAQEILKDDNVTISPVTSDQFITKATRPEYSIMDLEKAKSTGYEIISWQTALQLFLEGIK